MKTTLTPALIERVAARFRILGEPARLRLVQALMDGERSVGELVESTDLGQANVSKHLQILHLHGFVSRRKNGQFVHYQLADPSVYQLCDVMCGSVAASEDSWSDNE